MNDHGINRNLQTYVGFSNALLNSLIPDSALLAPTVGLRVTSSWILFNKVLF
jgi:hypothetical protein